MGWGQCQFTGEEVFKPAREHVWRGNSWNCVGKQVGGKWAACESSAIARRALRLNQELAGFDKPGECAPGYSKSWAEQPDPIEGSSHATISTARWRCDCVKTSLEECTYVDARNSDVIYSAAF